MCVCVVLTHMYIYIMYVSPAVRLCFYNSSCYKKKYAFHCERDKDRQRADRQEKEIYVRLSLCVR